MCSSVCRMCFPIEIEQADSKRNPTETAPTPTRKNFPAEEKGKQKVDVGQDVEKEDDSNSVDIEHSEQRFTFLKKDGQPMSRKQKKEFLKVSNYAYPHFVTIGNYRGLGLHTLISDHALDRLVSLDSKLQYEGVEQFYQTLKHIHHNKALFGVTGIFLDTPIKITEETIHKLLGLPLHPIRFYNMHSDTFKGQSKGLAPNTQKTILFHNPALKRKEWKHKLLSPFNRALFLIMTKTFVPRSDHTNEILYYDLWLMTSLLHRHEICFPYIILSHMLAKGKQNPYGHFITHIAQSEFGIVIPEEEILDCSFVDEATLVRQQVSTKENVFTGAKTEKEGTKNDEQMASLVADLEEIKSQVTAQGELTKSFSQTLAVLQENQARMMDILHDLTSKNSNPAPTSVPVQTDPFEDANDDSMTSVPHH